MGSLRTLAVALLPTVLLMSCLTARPTEVTTLWREPTTPAIRFTKSLAIFTGEDSTLRRQIENRIAGRVQGTVPSHRLIPIEQLTDTQAVRAVVEREGYDGVIVMQLVGVEQRTADSTHALYPPTESLWEYLRRTPRAAFRPGREIAITMESSVYAVKDGKLVWVGRSTSFNPLSTRDLVGTIVDASIDEARSQRLF
jgi:hypothetical protein